MRERHKSQTAYEYAKGAYSYYKKYGFAAIISFWWEWLIIKPERLTAVSTLCIFIAATVTAGIGFAQWAALQEQIVTTRAQIAAYLSVPDEPFSFIKIGEDGTISGTLYIENSGQSPARNVYVRKQLKWAETNFIPKANLTAGFVGGPMEIPVNKPRGFALEGKIASPMLTFVGERDSFIIFDGAVLYETIFGETISHPLEMAAWCCGISGFNKETQFFHVGGPPGWVQTPPSQPKN